MNQNPAGAPWSSFIVLEYKDLQALAAREVIKDKARAELAVSNAEWKKVERRQDCDAQGEGGDSGARPQPALEPILRVPVVSRLGSVAQFRPTSDSVASG